MQGFTDVQLKAGDCIATEQEGLLPIAVGNITGGIETKGWWLYVIVIPVKGSFTSNTVGNIVSTESYMNWYRSATWDANGNPLETSSPTPTPTPSPSPTTPSSISGACWTLTATARPGLRSVIVYMGEKCEG